MLLQMYGMNLVGLKPRPVYNEISSMEIDMHNC